MFTGYVRNSESEWEVEDFKNWDQAGCSIDHTT
jgi:hypothetical protein